jgi:hypothetical protein
MVTQAELNPNFSIFLSADEGFRNLYSKHLIQKKSTALSGARK